MWRSSQARAHRRFIEAMVALAAVLGCGDQAAGPTSASEAGASSGAPSEKRDAASDASAGSGSSSGSPFAGSGSSGVPSAGSGSAPSGAASGSDDASLALDAPGVDADASAGNDATTGDASLSIDAGRAEAGPPSSAQALKQAFVDLRFGIFLHFGILTYTGTWAQPNLDITQFNPTALAPKQWAAAAKSAGMTFGVLTTRHHDGFALWPSAASTFNVGHIPWQNGKGDVVRQYVDAFRAAGLLPAFYYSIWDTTQGTSASTPTPAQLAYIETQLTELMSNYGPIPLLVLDGWSWKMGHNAVAFQRIHDLVKSLQPNILITDHDGLQVPFDEDIVMYEEPKGVFAPPGNVWAAGQDNKINASGGNDWFWAPNIGNLMTTAAIVNGHLDLLGPRHTTFILNCPPNRQGLLDQAIVDRLAQVGPAWQRAAVPPLPDQGIQNNHPYTPVSASATSGTAFNAIDGVNDARLYTVWQSSGTLPQSITLDLGTVKTVGFLGYVPPYSNTTGAATTTGAITSYAVSVSKDGTTFAPGISGTWPADGSLQHATFGPVDGRYVRLDALAASGGLPAATEITVGGVP